MTRLVLRDALLDAQVLRAVGSAGYGGADVGECLATAARVSEGDLSSWHDEWLGTARSASALAEVEQAAGRCESARLAYLRACTYFRTAGVMLLGTPLDARLVESNRLQTAAFRRAAGLMVRPPEILEIPFEATTMPGYFFRAGDEDRPRATVILTGGYDGTVEEAYFYNGAAALSRGYNVLAFDGPGQGGMLLQQGVHLRADWENVVGPVIDYALTRPDVDPERIALIGLSLGAHLAPRAASSDHRLAACIADCGSYDLHASALARMPGPLAARFDRGNRTARALVGRILTRLMHKPTAGWAIRRGLLVHDLSDPLEWIDALREYTLKGRAEHITCPTWVCNAEGDDISDSAPQLVAALTCPHHYTRFTAAQGAGDHCEAGARALYHAHSFGWLDHLLTPHSTTQRSG